MSYLTKDDSGSSNLNSIFVYFPIFTVLLAFAIPNLELFISLFGALCLSTLGLAFPAIIEIATYWDHTDGVPRQAMLLKDVVLIVVGVAGFVIGTYTSMAAIISTFS